MHAAAAMHASLLAQAQAHLAVVAAQYRQAGGGIGAVHVHRVAVGGCKVLTAGGEAAVAGGLDGQLAYHLQVVCRAAAARWAGEARVAGSWAAGWAP